MKKIILSIISIILLFSVLCSCGLTKEKTPIEKTPIEKCRDKIVEIAEGYLDFEITRKEAIESLKDISIPTGENWNSTSVSIYKDSLIIALMNNDNDTYNDVMEAVEKLKNITLIEDE